MNTQLIRIDSNTHQKLKRYCDENDFQLGELAALAIESLLDNSTLETRIELIKRKAILNIKEIKI